MGSPGLYRIEPLPAGDLFHDLVGDHSSFPCCRCFSFFSDVIFFSIRPDALAIAGLVAGLAFVTRYAGITLIGTGGLLLCGPVRS